MSNRLYLNFGDACPFSPFSVCPQGSNHPKRYGFLSVWRFLAFLCPPMDPAVCMMHGFLPPGPMPPFSAHACLSAAVTELRPRKAKSHVKDSKPGSVTSAAARF